ncbi:MAG: hypothetical protein IJH11_03580 [Lachnospiraceae bacterium]|nr:hypothetical protein [Lachnospiraceae bacterium]
MRNEIIYDEKGNPDVMVTFAPDEFGLPETLKGRPVKEYCISKYQNYVVDGTPYSMPFQVPEANVTFDKAISLCESKGPGWHLMTNDEWAAIALWCYNHGIRPTGNISSGEDDDGGHGEKFDVRTLTGSGPNTWNHDGTSLGVADLVGNVVEFVGGVRFVNGRLQIIPDNGAAAGADQSKDSDDWQPVLTSEGKPVIYGIDGNRMVITDDDNEDLDWGGDFFKDIKTKCEIPDVLKRLALYPPEGFDWKDWCWIDNDGESLVCRGGHWAIGTSAGLFYLLGLGARTNTIGGIGFRSAFVRYADNL